MSSWVHWLPFVVGCIASGVRIVIWETTAVRAASHLAFLAGSWFWYGMLVITMIIEWRHFALRSRPPRFWAYFLALISNAVMPILYTFGFVEGYLGIPLLRNPSPILAPVLGLVLFIGYPFGLVSWAIVTFLCLFKDRSSKVPGRVLPAAFAVLGAVEHGPVGFGILFNIP